ncbi:hypothetical protein TcCL_Unassigned07352, partial [Trypanosoma cruzi]
MTRTGKKGPRTHTDKQTHTHTHKCSFLLHFPPLPIPHPLHFFCFFFVLLTMLMIFTGSFLLVPSQYSPPRQSIAKTAPRFFHSHPLRCMRSAYVAPGMTNPNMPQMDNRIARRQCKIPKKFFMAKCPIPNHMPAPCRSTWRVGDCI